MASMFCRSIEEVVGGLLSARGWRVAAAESCTGGLLTQRLTEIAGSSAWVRGGVVAYANEVKVQELGVPARDILVELGRKKMIGGQEDMIEDTAITMARERGLLKAGAA